MSRRPPVGGRAGAAIALYAAVTAATLALAGPRVLPLFEGFSPPEPYAWVQPPTPYAPGNQAPAPAAVSQDAGGALSLTTPDGQCTVSLAGGAIAPPAGDTRVTAKLTPLAAPSLAALPAGLFADGNAYRVDLVGQPSGALVSRLQAPGHLVIKGVLPVRAVLFSAGGQSWSVLPNQSVGGPTVAGTLFSRTGIYLAASAADPANVAARRTGGAGTAAVALAVAALAAAFLLVPAGIRRLAARG